MKVQVSHRVLFLTGPSIGNLVAVCQVLDQGGNVVESGHEVPLTPGAAVSFGDVTLDVPYPGAIGTETDAAATPGPHPAVAAKPGTQPAPPPPRR